MSAIVRAQGDGNAAPTLGVAQVVRSQPSNDSSFQPGFVSPQALGSAGDRPKLYDNTSICTTNTNWLAVGANTDGAVKLNIRDWFTTNGGGVAGFEVFVVNPDTNRDQRITNMEFFNGTDAENQGVEFGTRKIFNPTRGPSLERVPANSANPQWPLRLAVDYINDTYTIAEGVLNEITGEFDWIELTSEPLQGREGFDLPAGKIGFNFRHAVEDSVCQNPPGDPVFGPVMANGGEGTDNGVYIVNADVGCTQGQRNDLPCPGTSGFDGASPCQGGDDCNLQRSFYGIALTIYASPGPEERGDGNNDIETATEVAAPPVGSGDIVSVGGFIGDNGQSYTSTPVTCFDRDSDLDVDVLDWAGMQVCFGDDIPNDCRLYDCDGDGRIDLNDFQAFRTAAEGGDPQCACAIPDPPLLLKDVDIYRVSGLTAGRVVSVLLEGAKSPIDGPLWDPYLRIFGDLGGGFVELQRSDDYERFSLDAFVTVMVPETLEGDALYVGVSSAADTNYDPQDPITINELGVEEAGGYALSIAVTDPLSVVDDLSGGTDDCYESKHEPDDTLAYAMSRGPTNILSPVIGSVGDGAFGPLGQDLDVYMIDLSEAPFEDTRSLQIFWRIPGPAGGFETVFDLTVGLYDANGALVACGDQIARWSSMGFDHTPPGLFGNVIGGETYYLAVFGTDRIWVDQDGDPAFPAVPPSLLNFPHGPDTPGTHGSDLRPLVGGRVNRIAPPLAGPNPDDPNESLFRQCYKIDIIDSTDPLACSDIGVPCDPDENADPLGNDSIPLASESLVIGEMLSGGVVTAGRYLGNGPYGGAQGDVDFYRLDGVLGKILAVHIADREQPPITNNWIRSYLVLMDENGVVFADHDYSLEMPNVDFALGFTDAIAATVVGTAPTDTVYVCCGTDAGNLLLRENMPFDLSRPGTTLSNRFNISRQQVREYGTAVTVRDPAAPLLDGLRMFVVPERGFDDRHVATDLPYDGAAPPSFPPILELDPSTGKTIKTLDGGPAFSTYQDLGSLAGVRSTNPILAYDGERLWVSVDELDIQFFDTVDHYLFVIDPSTGEIGGLGRLFRFGLASFLTGMVEIDGRLYALESSKIEPFRYPDLLNVDNLLSWDKLNEFGEPNSIPDIDIVSLAAPAGEFDNLDGDLGTDGTHIYIGCFLDEVSVGICAFDTDGMFVGMIPNHVTNPGLIPGPRLGGFDIVDDGGGEVVVASDRNGPLIEMAYRDTSQSRGAYELPRGLRIVRLTIR